MRGLKGRVDAIERAGGDVPLTPAVKAWLGQSLTQGERLALECGNDDEPIDMSKLSAEEKAWLGAD